MSVLGLAGGDVCRCVCRCVRVRVRVRVCVCVCGCVGARQLYRVVLYRKDGVVLHGVGQT